MTTAQTIFDQINERKRQALATYEQLTRSAADGESIDAADVENVLQNAGKTPQDFLADTQHLERRQQMRDQLRQQSQLSAELADARQALEAIDAIHAEKIAALKAERRPLAANVERLHGAAVGINSGQLRNELANGCRDDSLRAIYNMAGMEIEKLTKAISGKQNALQRMQEAHTAAAHRNDVKQTAMYAERIDRLKEEIAALNAERTEQQQSQEEARQAMIDW